MADDLHRLVHIDEVKFVGAQKSSDHLQDVCVGEVLTHAGSLANRKGYDNILEIFRTFIIKAIWVIDTMVTTPYAFIVVQSVDVRGDLSLENKGN